MACNLLAHQRREMFLGAGFDPVRRLVLDGAGDPWDFIGFNTSPDETQEAAALGELDHVIVLSGERATGVVRGLVSLYGHLQFVVVLGSAADRQVVRDGVPSGPTGPSGSPR